MGVKQFTLKTFVSYSSCVRILYFLFVAKLPDEEYAESLPILYKFKVRHNHLVERAPFYIPRFILELSRFVRHYIS